MSKNILITGANSDIARELIEILKDKDFHIFATYRKNFPKEDKNFTPLFLDILDDASFEALLDKISDIKFGAVVNCAGIAITSPVSALKSEDLKHQADTVLLGLSRLLRFIYPNLDKNSKVINISSMAAFGVFPYISPYCATKAAADILLNSFEIETGIRCVSVKPGVVRTKFWEYCIEINKDNFENFALGYEDIGKFLLNNAKLNKNKGISPADVAKVIFKAVVSKHPKHSYVVGCDAYFASVLRFVPKCILNPVIRKVLNFRVRKFLDGKQ